MNVNKININQSESTYYIASDIYDVSYHNNGATFASLSALLSAENLSTLIPSAVRCGGMTIRFVQSSDNKYVQYRLMSATWSTVVTNWQGVDEHPTAGSDNLVKSGGVFSSISDETERAIAAERATTIAEINTLNEKIDAQKNEVNAAKEDALQAIAENEQSAITNFNSQRVTPDMLSESTKQLIEASGGGTITNLADDEDLTSVDDGTGSNVLKFADRTYNPDNFSGKGYKILRKNIVDGKNILTQNMINKSDTIYVIKYDFILGENITIPTNCTLEFDGGSVSGGTLIGNNTKIKKFNGFEIENKNSVKYLGTFISNETFVYKTIVDAKKYIHFPGQNISTMCYASLGDKGAANYVILSATQCANENKYFMDYWHNSTVAGGSGLYTKASSINDLWLRLIPTNSINLSLFGVVSDAHYKHTDGLYYKDSAHTIEATDNYNAFQAAIGQLQWWGISILPNTIILSGRIVINTPIHLYHGSYSFSLVGDGFERSEITTNRNIECLMYNAHGKENISNLTGFSCYINRIIFNGNNLASDCLVLKNGYERDNISECAFSKAVNNGIRLWGISSTFKLTNITAFNNGKYGVLLCEEWNHNGIDYSSNFEGLASLYEISGDNNLALIGVDIAKSAGSSINIQSVKIEEPLNLGIIEKNGCGIHIKNLAAAVDLCITNAFMNTNENLPFIVYEDNRGGASSRGTIKLFSVFNNNTSSNSTTIIKDTALNKTIAFHSRGNAPVTLIYTNDFDNNVFAHGISLYRNGVYAGGLGEEYYINTENIDLKNTYPVERRTQINNKALPVTDAYGKVGFLNKQKGIIDSEGNKLSEKLTFTFNPLNKQYAQQQWDVSSPTPTLLTIKSSGFTGVISIYVCEGSNPVKLLTEFTISNTGTTYSKYFIQPYQANGHLMFYRRSMTTDGDITVTLYRHPPIKQLLSNISDSVINTSFKHVGSTSERPRFGAQFQTVRNSISGFQYFDTTLGKPIYWNGASWVDATGAEV